MTSAKPEDIVLAIIKESKKEKLKYITKPQILVEAKDTPLAEYADVYGENDKTSKMERKVNQAIYRLHRKRKIKDMGHGKWTVNGVFQIKAKVCKHIIKKEDKWYCPVKKSYIGNPKSQCSILYTTDLTKPIKKFGDGIVKVPRCPGFVDKKSNKINIEISRMHIERQERREEVAKRKRK